MDSQSYKIERRPIARTVLIVMVGVLALEEYTNAALLIEDPHLDGDGALLGVYQRSRSRDQRRPQAWYIDGQLYGGRSLY